MKRRSIPKPKKHPRPINPVTGKPRRGRPSREELAAREQPVQAKAQQVRTDSSSSTEPDQLQRALDELDRGTDSPTQAVAPGKAAETPIPLLSPADLVDISETLIGLGLAFYALVTRREIPAEDRLKLSEGSRKLCGITAQGTIDAAGPMIAENAQLLRWIAPIGFGSTLALHALQRISEVRKQAPKRTVPAAPVHHEAESKPRFESAAPPPIPEPGDLNGRLQLPEIPPSAIGDQE